MQLLAYLHQLSWSTLLGMQFFQSFFAVKLAYAHLPRSAFLALQRGSFPVYFRLQAGLLAATIFTAPFTALLERGNVWGKTLPLGLGAACAVLNVLVWEPRTAGDMDATFGRKSDGMTGAEGSSVREQRMKAFKFAHSMSIHLNAVTMACTAWYSLGLVHSSLGQEK